MVSRDRPVRYERSPVSRPAARYDPVPGVQPRPVSPAAPRLNLTAAGAVVLMLLFGAVGVGVDLLFDDSLGLATTVLLPIGAFLAALLVRRPGRFVVAVAPPLVYLSLVVIALGLDGPELSAPAVATGVVIGFPAMAVATAITVLVGALRQVSAR